MNFKVRCSLIRSNEHAIPRYSIPRDPTPYQLQHLYYPPRRMRVHESSYSVVDLYLMFETTFEPRREENIIRSGSYYLEETP